MIDLDLSSTPAEEMEGLPRGSETPPPPKGAAGLKEAMRPSPPRPGVVDVQMATHDRDFVPTFANDKKEKLRDMSEKNLRWFAGALGKSVANPEKARFLADNQLALAAVRSEMLFRGL
jgi:hypothetical protein